MREIFFKESKDYYDSLEAVIPSELFGGRMVQAVAKKCGELYARRCRQHFDNMPADLLDKLQRATAAYIIDLIEEHEDEFDLPAHFIFDEETPTEEVMQWIKPLLIVFDCGILHDDDAPPAYSIKLMFAPVPDEYIEWVIRDDSMVYVGEYREISPWNEKVLKKKWNYINAI